MERSSLGSGRRAVILAFWFAALGSPWAAQDSRPAGDPLREARAALAAGEFEAAIERLAAPFEASPDDVEINLLLGEARLGTMDLRAANRHAARAYSGAPRDPRAATLIGHVLFRMAERDAERSGPQALVAATFADAATAYEEAASLGGDPYESRYWAAEAQDRAGFPDKALAAIDRALAARPRDAAALAVKGHVLLRAWRPADALPVLEEAIAAGPGSPAAADAACDVVLAHLDLGDLAALPATFERFVWHDPLGAAARIWQIASEALRGGRKESVWASLLDAAADEEPDAPLVAYWRTELAIRRGDGRAALPLADRYRTLAPNDPDGRVFRAIALRLLSRLDEARVELGKAHDLAPGRASTQAEFRYLAKAFFDAGRYRQAADVQEFVVHLSGLASDRHDHAILLVDAGKADEADRAYRAIAADMSVPAAERSRAWNALALLLRGQGRREDAERALREAVREDPENLDAHENLGILLVGAGRIEEGEGELRVAMTKNPEPQPRRRSAYHLWRSRHPEAP